MSARDAFRDAPIRRKLALLLAASTGVGLVIASVALIAYTWVHSRDAERRDLQTVARITGDSAIAALAFNDARAAEELLGALRAKESVELGCLYGVGPDGAARLFARFEARPNVRCPALPGAPGLAQTVGSITLVREVVQGGDRLGWLQVQQDLAGLRRAIGMQVAIMLAILAASFMASISIAWVLQRALVEPLLRLAGVARSVSETRDYAQRVEKGGDDEVGHLIDDFNQMLDQIGQREWELERARAELEIRVGETSRANSGLEEALARLKDAQAQLIQNERLAALGSLVAGVAHEINTPVGVGVTAASTLQDRTAELRRAYDSGALKRSDLETFVAVAQECGQIILKNLQRAADLIHGFKQVAVDQTSGERRRFALREYVEEVLLSLAPTLKKSGHQVEVSCPPDLHVDSYPGALAQILTNLIGNSVVHGYDEGQHGRIRIEVSEHRGWIALSYRDDGRGIPRENQARVYDPFFTTRRAQGGSGLGMHIVHSLVTQILGGTIELRSEPGRGVEFRIGFPANLRKAAA